MAIVINTKLKRLDSPTNMIHTYRNEVSLSSKCVLPTKLTFRGRGRDLL